MAEPTTTIAAVGWSVVKAVILGASFLGGLVGLSVSKNKDVWLGFTALLCAVVFGYFGTLPVVKWISRTFDYTCDIDDIGLIAVLIGIGGMNIAVLAMALWQLAADRGVGVIKRLASKRLGIPETTDERKDDGPAT